MCHQLRHRIKSMVGISTDVMIVNCGSIPRSEGKACRVFDLRNIVGALTCRLAPGEVKRRGPEVDTTCAMIHKSQQ